MRNLDAVLNDAVAAHDVPDTHDWFDPARDVAAVIMTQSLPFVELRFMNVYERYERAVYAGA